MISRTSLRPAVRPGRPPLLDVDVPKLDRRNCPVAGTCQNYEGYQCAIAAIDLGCDRHRSDDVADLLERREAIVAAEPSRSWSSLVGKIKILAILIGDSGLKAG